MPLESHTEPIRVLNVDDSDSARYVRRRLLCAAGFLVEDAATGADALRSAEQDQPNVVLLDVRLPDVDGFEVCRRLRNGPLGSQVVIVHVSAEAADAHSQASGLENGADAYLTEPVHPGVLLATIRALLRAREAEENERRARADLQLDSTERKRAEDELRRALAEARQAEAALRSRTAKLDSLLANAPIGLAFVDTEHRYIRINDELCRINGLPRDAHLGRRVSEVLPLNAIMIDPLIDEVLSTGKSIQREVTGETPKEPGAERHWLTAFYPVFGGVGREITAVGGLVVDITDRRRMEEALRDGEQRYRAVFERAAIGICRVSFAEARWIEVNDPFCRMLGYTRDELLATPWPDITHPDDVDLDVTPFRQMAAGELESYSVEKRFIHKDGHTIWACLTLSLVRDPEGRPDYEVAVIEDISDRKNAEAALRESEERLRVALDAARLGTWKYTFDGHVWELDDRARSLYNTRSNRMVHDHETLAAMLHPDDVPRMWERVQKAADPAGDGHYEMQYRVLQDEGNYRWLAAWGQVQFEGEGPARKGVRIVGASRDITSQKRQEEALVQTQKLESIGVLAGGIAHDFNNLLTGILGNISLASESLPEQAPQRAQLDAAARASERAAELTRQLLAYAGKGRFVTHTVDLSALIAETRELIASSIPKNAEVRLDLAPDLPAVEGDPAQLSQLVMNLVINGAEAIPKDQPGIVSVRTSVVHLNGVEVFHGDELAHGDYVSVEVADNGIGMDEATQFRIFDPFFTTKFTGRGLGLAAVSGIVRGHQGALTVNSSPGQGSRFAVYLPVAGPAEPAHEPAKLEEKAGEGTILVVDDEAQVRDVARMILERRGYEVLLAENGLQAVQMYDIHRERISAVLLDFDMPVMNGPQALSILRQKAPDLKVLLTSGYNEADAIRRFRYSGASGFVQKPYTAAILSEKISRAVS